MNKLKSIWQIEDLRKKILFTLLLILVFRLGCSIPVPFVSNTALDSMFSNDSIFGYMNMLSGGALSRCAFFALGVSPYINSSIITQLLCVALPSWEALQKETTGKDKLDEYTKRIALAMAAIMSIGYYFVLRNYGALEYTAGKSGFFAAVVIMATFLAGSQLSVWIGGRIDEFGIGNGVSILIFAGIVSRWTDINTIAHNIAVQVESGNWLYSLVGIGMVVAMLFAVWFVSYSDGAERRIPVQYAARKYNARGQASYIPVNLLMSGVMPIIFAGVIMSILTDYSFTVPNNKVSFQGTDLSSYTAKNAETGVWTVTLPRALDLDSDAAYVISTDMGDFNGRVYQVAADGNKKQMLLADIDSDTRDAYQSKLSAVMKEVYRLLSIGAGESDFSNVLLDSNEISNCVPEPVDSDDDVEAIQANADKKALGASVTSITVTPDDTIEGYPDAYTYRLDGNDGVKMNVKLKVSTTNGDAHMKATIGMRIINGAWKIVSIDSKRDIFTGLSVLDPEW